MFYNRATGSRKVSLLPRPRLCQAMAIPVCPSHALTRNVTPSAIALGAVAGPSKPRQPKAIAKDAPNQINHAQAHSNQQVPRHSKHFFFRLPNRDTRERYDRHKRFANALLTSVDHLLTPRTPAVKRQPFCCAFAKKRQPPLFLGVRIPILAHLLAASGHSNRPFQACFTLPLPQLVVTLPAGGTWPRHISFGPCHGIIGCGWDG